MSAAADSSPALTDEQIDTLTRDVLCMGPTMSTWYAAVIAKAKQEEREQVIAALRARFGVTNRAADWLSREADHA